MSNSIGSKIKLTIFGQSHSEMIGCTIEGLPAGVELDMQAIQADLDRRRGGEKKYTTPRKEADTPRIICGLVDGVTCGAPLTALFENSNTQSKDYSELRIKPRPGHADYTAYVKTDGTNDIRGGGEFSGRLTLPFCFAGAIAKQLLLEKGITVGAHIYSIGNITDTPYDPVSLSAKDLIYNGIPTNNEAIWTQMEEYMTEVAATGDSVGGIIECGATGLPAGLGSPMFGGVENEISRTVFAIPAVKGIEFGAGFGVAQMLGTQNNDAYTVTNGKITTKTNNCGGILGGITNSMPLIFRCAIKPTPSISIEQDTVDLNLMSNTKLKIHGRHDPCIVPRALVVVEAACALTLINLL